MKGFVVQKMENKCYKNLLIFLGECTNRFFGFAHLCEKVNLHSVLLYSCANKMAALTRPNAVRFSRHDVKLFFLRVP